MEQNVDPNILKPIQVQTSIEFIVKILSTIKYMYLPETVCNQPYKVTKLTENFEYRKVKQLFDGSFSYKNMKITKIEIVENPLLYAQYCLKKLQKSQPFVTELELFHGTKKCNIDNICQYNFNWRLVGHNGFLGGKFGNGVAFSPRASYARDYPRRHFESPRVMFLVKVLENARCVGRLGQSIPEEPYDTTIKSDGDVVVKYYDNEFYPEFIIYYDE